LGKLADVMKINTVVNIHYNVYTYDEMCEDNYWGR
jgi:hypothetical protein